MPPTKKSRPPYPPEWDDEGPSPTAKREYVRICEHIDAAQPSPAPGQKSVRPYLQDIATLLGRALSTLSKTLSELEAYFGLHQDDLIERSGHVGCAIAHPKGRALYETFVEELKLHEQATRKETAPWARAEKVVAQTVRIGSPSVFTAHTLPWVINQCRSEWKKQAALVDFDIRDGTFLSLLSQLRNGECSLVIGVGGFNMDGLTATPIEGLSLQPHLLIPPLPPKGANIRDRYQTLRKLPLDTVIEMSVLGEHPLVVSDNIEVLEGLPAPAREKGGTRTLVDNILLVVNHVRQSQSLGVVFGWPSLFAAWEKRYDCEVRPLKLNNPIRYQVQTYVRAGKKPSDAVELVEQLVHKYFKELGEQT